MEKNCWNCGKVMLGGPYFPGRCSGFKDLKGNKLEPKEIPATVVDVGCRYWIEKPKKEAKDGGETDAD